MNDQDLINTCVFEQIQGLLFTDLSGPLKIWNNRRKMSFFYSSLKINVNYFMVSFLGLNIMMRMLILVKVLQQVLLQPVSLTLPQRPDVKI